LNSHGHEAEDEQIDAGGDDSEAEQDENETQCHVAWFIAQSMVVLSIFKK
jgi:hypothetical protein